MSVLGWWDCGEGVMETKYLGFWERGFVATGREWEGGK